MPSGRFQARYRVGSVEHLAPQTFSTARDAHPFLATTRTTIERGALVDVDAGTVPLAHYATRWLRERVLLRPRTYELYEGLLRLHIQHATQERDQAIAQALNEAIGRAAPRNSACVIALRESRS